MPSNITTLIVVFDGHTVVLAEDFSTTRSNGVQFVVQTNSTKELWSLDGEFDTIIARTEDVRYELKNCVVERKDTITLADGGNSDKFIIDMVATEIAVTEK